MKKILVFHSWGIGDMIMATPMIRSLDQSGYHIELIVTSSAVRSIIQNAPFIQKIHLIRSFKDYLFFCINHRNHFDILIATLGINAKKINILGKLLGIKTIFSGQAHIHQHHIDQNLLMVSPLLTISDSSPYVNVAPMTEQIHSHLHPMKKNIGLAIGSGKQQRFKRWSAQYFLELIQLLGDVNIIIFIGPDENDLENFAWPANTVVLKQLKLEEISTLISSLDFLIGNDNGLMHIGYAHQIQTYTVFGMTDPLEVGGYSNQNYSIVSNIECSPCFHGNVHKVACKTQECLKIITPKVVYETIVSDLQTKGIAL